MSSDIRKFRINNIEHNERVEQRDRSTKSIRVRKCGKRISSCNEQHPQTAGFDLINHGRDGHLADHSRQFRTRERTNKRRSSILLRREPVHHSSIESHSAGDIEGIGHDQQDPPKPFRKHTIG
jgi:hypothetical protein